jgi:hypothetical protein
MVAYLVNLFIIVGTLLAAVLLGSRFLAEVRKAHRQGDPWYTPYLTLPGILVILALSLPVLYWVLSR